jgi:hypothetical protein
MTEFEITKERRDEIIRAVERHGATVLEDWNEPEGARFIGTIEKSTITLYPKYDSHFAMYFTVAHLYGHLVQWAAPTPETKRAFELSLQQGVPFANAEVQALYDYELQAAAIGRRVMEECGPVPREVDRQYARIFHADFHYLVHVLETGQGGPELFDRFLRREPVPAALIAADPRPLIDVSGLAEGSGGGGVAVL